MSTLKDKAQEILSEKEEKIVPENFSENLEIFGVQGNMLDFQDIELDGWSYVDFAESTGLNITSTFDIPDGSAIVNGMSSLHSNVSYNDIVLAINLTSDKIKSGENVLGVIGTYNGGGNANMSTASIYSSTPYSICRLLTSIPSINTTYVRDFREFFAYCSNLRSIPEFDSSGIQEYSSTSKMFYDCSNISTIPYFNTANVHSMPSMFDGCSELVEIPNLDTSNVSDMTYFCRGCNHLLNIPAFDLSSVQYATEMFYGCTNLVDVPVLNLYKLQQAPRIFNNCINLSNSSLDNIVTSFATINSYGLAKELSYHGLTQEQANRCVNSPNWNMLVDKGWTTGY